MKFAIGNGKLGKHCNVVSREVGPTCPPDCAYLGNGCYAERTQSFRKAAHQVGISNRSVDEVRVRSMLYDAHKHNRYVRWFERGDAGSDGRVDTAFLSSVRAAYESLPPEQRPESWVYTHFNKSALVVEYLSDHVSVYASVHSEADIKAAKDNGFTLFAFCDDESKYTPKKNRRRPYDPALCPKTVEVGGEQFVVCPEIRLGRGRVTCTGTKDTTACKLCPLGKHRAAVGRKANVMFPYHV